MIEQGRKIRPKLSQSERICQLCNDGLNGAVEDFYLIVLGEPTAQGKVY